jgi:hypothetical protein
VKKCLLLFSVLFLLFNSILKGQNNAPSLPQRTVSLSKEIDLNFGEFIIINNGISGDVTIQSDGTPSSHNVYEINKEESPQAARLSFHLCPGRSITPVWPSSFTLTSAYGAPIVALLNHVSIGNTLLTNGQPFSSNKGCSDTHYIYIGGTLQLNPITNYQGVYTGSFNFTINNE